MPTPRLQRAIAAVSAPAAAGKLFLIMQLSRILVVFLMWIEPPFWLFVVATIGWGLNMGITTNLTRNVCASLHWPYLGRILSVFSIGMVGSALGAVVLGWLIEATGTLNALIPAMLLSGILFSTGTVLTGLGLSQQSAGNNLDRWIENLWRERGLLVCYPPKA